MYCKKFKKPQFNSYVHFFLIEKRIQQDQHSNKQINQRYRSVTLLNSVRECIHTVQLLSRFFPLLLTLFSSVPLLHEISPLCPAIFDSM